MTLNEDVPIDLYPVEDVCRHACHELRKLDLGWWVLSIDEGHIDIMCEVCRCSFDGIADGTEIVYSEQDLPVKLTFQRDCSGGYHGENMCDHDWYFLVEPRSTAASGG